MKKKMHFYFQCKASLFTTYQLMFWLRYVEALCLEHRLWSQDRLEWNLSLSTLPWIHSLLVSVSTSVNWANMNASLVAVAMSRVNEKNACQRPAEYLGSLNVPYWMGICIYSWLCLCSACVCLSRPGHPVSLKQYLKTWLKKKNHHVSNYIPIIKDSTL